MSAAASGPSASSVPRIGWDKGLGERPLREDPPEQVWEHQRRDESIANRSRANFGSDQNIANEPQNPAAHSQRGLCQGVPQEAHSGLSELETIGRAGTFSVSAPVCLDHLVLHVQARRGVDRAVSISWLHQTRPAI